MTPSKRVLVVEDDAIVRRALRAECERDGYKVIEAATGADALRDMETANPDIVLLDMVLPDISGLDVCRHLRRLDQRTPILIVSGRSDEIDVVVGMEVGADDYIVKPYRSRELLARMNAHLRKVQAEAVQPAQGRLAFRGLTIDLEERVAARDGLSVDLTHTEFDLLAFMAINAGRVLSRERILNHVWGYDYPVETRVIDVHVRNLRKKLEADPAKPSYILAVPGIGYRFTSARPG